MTTTMERNMTVTAAAAAPSAGVRAPRPATTRLAVTTHAWPAGFGTAARTAASALAGSAAKAFGGLRSSSALRKVLLALPVPVAVLVLWTIGAQQAWVLPFGIQMGFIPTPAEVAVRLWSLAFGSTGAFAGTLGEHLLASTQRVAGGFFAAALVAAPLGIVMGRYKPVYLLLEPAINMLRPIPVTAWAPLVLVVLGFGEQASTFLIFIATFFPVWLNTVAGVGKVPVRLVEAARMLGTSRRRILTKVVLPAAMPSIVSGLRIGLAVSWMVLVVAEQVGISTGLGALLTRARDLSLTDVIIATMVIFGLCGFLADRLLMSSLRTATRVRPTLL